ncbi:MAG: alkaline phosphatase D family protein [Rubripirellula sp.]
MMDTFPRRIALKLLGIGSAWFGFGRIGSSNAQDAKANPSATTVSWKNTQDRVWLDGRIWANPMEDWHVVDGAAECLSAGGFRNLQLITHEITNPQGSIAMSVVVRRLELTKLDNGVGFQIGIQSDLNEYRSNSFAKSGIRAGVIDGKLALDRNRIPIELNPEQEFQLNLTGKSHAEGYELKLTATDASGKAIGEVTKVVSADSILGNVALVNNYDAKKGQGARYRFNEWSVAGDAFTVRPERQFGPILWSMYSLSDSRSDEGFVMKISALTGPMGTDANKDVELLVKQNDTWESKGTAQLDIDAWTATFRIPNWDETKTTPYRLVYREKLRDGGESESDWTGTIKPNPSGRPLRIGALTCQNHYGFPYEPVANNVTKLDPDLLYFSGDQLYESHGGYGLIREPAEPAILNYLRKYYMFGWSFRDAMRDRPTICIADDHDVFQGNIWGEGGKPMDVKNGGASSNGGYIEPARMVNVVHKTNTAHHPDYYDPTPVEQGISVYYGDMVYGNVGFAILGDRQFKSGPQHVDTGGGRADHVPDKDFDTSTLDKPGLVLLGDRQEKFLEAWGDDWRGHSMKILLSQTVFAGVATHHGKYDGYLKADLDSSGWPQTPRNQAIRILKKAKPLHINGDQHLTTLLQYGVDQQRDGCWSFCTPAIAAGYPRWWRPDELGMPHQNRPQHGLENTGEYLDGLGNKIYVYAVGNPEAGKRENRYKTAHSKGSGFGLVTVDTEAKTYLIESFRFLIDPTDGKESNQFPGWPVTIHQQENGGENIIR